MWDYLFGIQLNNSSRTKNIPTSSSFFTPDLDTICSIEITTLYHVNRGHVLCEAQSAAYYSFSMCGGRILFTWSRSTAVKSLRVRLVSQGPINAPFLRPFGEVEHHPHTRLSSKYGSDTNCKDLRHYVDLICNKL